MNHCRHVKFIKKINNSKTVWSKTVPLCGHLTGGKFARFMREESYWAVPSLLAVIPKVLLKGLLTEFEPQVDFDLWKRRAVTFLLPHLKPCYGYMSGWTISYPCISQTECAKEHFYMSTPLWHDKSCIFHLCSAEIKREMICHTLVHHDHISLMTL